MRRGRSTTAPDAVRVTVDGPEPLVREFEPGLVADPGGARRPNDAASASPSITRLPGHSGTGGPARYEVVVDGWWFVVDVEPASRAALRERGSRAGQRGIGAGRQVVRAQIPGRIVSVAVRVGEVVEASHPLLVVEAMKMENIVAAPWAGTIARVGVVAGQTVELGDELVVIE